MNPWAFQKDPIPWAIRLGEEVNCSHQENHFETLVECLRGKPFQDLIDANERLNVILCLKKIHHQYNYYSTIFYLPYLSHFFLQGSDISSYRFLPVIENASVGQFLTESPYELLRKGQFYKVPVMTGATRDEMAWFYRSLSKKYFK